MDQRQALLAGQILGLLLREEQLLAVDQGGIRPEVDENGNYLPVINVTANNGEQYQILVNHVTTISEQP